jgi:hypothetical protein
MLVSVCPVPWIVPLRTTTIICRALPLYFALVGLFNPDFVTSEAISIRGGALPVCSKSEEERGSPGCNITGDDGANADNEVGK